MLIGKQMEILVFNRAAAAFVRKSYGTELSEGMKIKDFFDESSIDDFTVNCHKALAGVPARSRRELPLATDNRWCHLSYDPAYDTEGQLMGVSFQVTDVTAKVP